MYRKKGEIENFDFHSNEILVQERRKKNLFKKKFLFLCFVFFLFFCFFNYQKKLVYVFPISVFFLANINVGIYVVRFIINLLFYICTLLLLFELLLLLLVNLSTCFSRLNITILVCSNEIFAQRSKMHAFGPTIN